MEKNKKSLRNSSGVKWVVLLAICAGSEWLVAQNSLETPYRMTGEMITGLFEPQRDVIQKCSAVIYNGRDEIAYGVVISKDGYILTKASEIQTSNGTKALVRPMRNLRSNRMLKRIRRPKKCRKPLFQTHEIVAPHR